ncbi:gmc oxidoreductase [Stemphylium lycopersici]|uniref:Gmc oxidoreductase n=1 Tax=Stemphylium lycopersici TaxID=183478 RepID=A0A364MXJ1_STELY|nr:gmc oxidoreductase [Stemphylium lycopersici]RAR05760.1 gmc oxidoreductase [Stemphylium lycopersici]
MSWILFFFSLVQTVCATCASQSFHYVIVGGGPAGLLVANRLSADPNTTVAVIEAGDFAYNNPNVTSVPKSILEFGLFIGTSIDWGYTTVPQKYAGNKTLAYWAGKALGGSTTINGMTYLRAETDQIDAWEDLGNPGWNWDTLWEYFLKQEGFQPPTDKLEQRGAAYEVGAHGRDGELAVGFTPYLVGQGFADLLKTTSEAMGIPYNQDPNDGVMRGFNTWPMTLNETGPTREDGARAFYYPVASRPNLHVFPNSMATRIIWDDSNSAAAGVLASGVEIVTAKDVTETIHASKEVVVAAGAIRSPAFLEHSGVGNPAVLEPLGIETVNPLHSIGANLPDQPQNGMVFSSSTNWTGYPTFVSYLTASDLFGEELAGLAEEVRANLSAYAATIVEDYANGTISVETQEHLLSHQVDLIFDSESKVPLAELLWAPTGNQIIAQLWNLLPLSRGSIHINSTDATLPPRIDPAFLQLPIDRYVQAAAAIRVRKYFATSPLADHITGELSPGFETVPQDAGWRDASWDAWIKQTLGGNSHPLSTCAMMQKDLGGVVDTEGKVYGTQNVRVVDASIFPTQISGHLSASVYAVAGRIAAVMMKAVTMK